MKTKRLLSVIAVILALLITLNTASAAMGTAADYLNEITATENSNESENDIFSPPEKSPVSENEDITVSDNALRFPDVQNSQSFEEAEYGEPIQIDKNSKVYQTGDRSFRTVFSEIPNTFENKWGKETEYNSTLVLKEKLFSSDYYTAKASDIKVRLPAEEETNPGISVEYDGVKVKLELTDGNYTKAAVKENAVRYNDVFDGVDVQYTLNALGMKEDIILNKYVDKSSFTYKLKVSGAQIVSENNALMLFKNGSETPTLTIAAPVMTDSNGAISDAVTLSLVDDILTVSADEEWIQAPERAYPIKIDPNFTVTSGKIDVATVSEHHGRYAAKAYGYVGDLTANQIGVPGAKDLGRTRMYFAINDDFSSIPEGSKINSASLRIYQYTKIGSSEIGCYRVEDAYDIGSIDFKKAITLNESIAGENSVLSSSVGFHEFDIRQTVNDWIRGIAPQYGLCVKALDEFKPIGAFFTPYSSSSNGGQGSFTEDKAPQIIVDWEVPNPVDPNYPLDNTTINLRTIIETNKDGLLRFHGIFADGVAQPNSVVNYALNDSSKENQTKAVYASPSYKYPDSTNFNSYFPARATKYKDILSNWQTVVPFTNPDFDTIYKYSATASKDGVTGNTVKSDEFLIYKIKQYDVLPKIANYYGVPISQIMYDNRVQDILLIENNTIIIRNSTKNGNHPYNPEPLDDDMKRRIDSALMGRGKHCEFGFEPINLNTGNFYMNQTDISIPDYNGNFSIERTYNSKNAGYNSIFGRGWQFAYSESLTKRENGEFIYSRGDGSSLIFTPQSNGEYSCPNGYYLTFTPIVVATKEGDFGGEELETYNVYEYEIKEANGTVKRFNFMGLLIKVTDEKGFTTTLTYDDNYNIASITSPAGKSYAFSYTADGYVNSVTLPNGKQLKYSYDDENNLIAYKDAAGNTTSYAYNAQHQMTSWSDANGDVVNTNEFDSEGRVTKQTDGNGNMTQLVYGDHSTTTTDANGNVTVYRYDDQYRTTKIEYANGSSEEKIYDAANNLAAVIDKNGNRTSYEYDGQGNLVKEIRFDGAEKTLSYNSENQLVESVDFNGATTRYTYADKNLVSVENADGSTTAYDYDSLHRIVKQTDGNGNVTEYLYDGAWLSEMKNPNGGINHYYYNVFGQLVTLVDALNQTTRFVYDDAGRKVQQQTADGAITKFEFDAAGNTVAITDANDSKFTFEHDANGNILKATDPYGNNTVYTYDGMNNRISETDPSGKTVTYTYDCFANVLTTTDADGNTTTLAYNATGKPIKITDPNGNETLYEYDTRFDKISKVTNAVGGIQTITYDTVGNGVSATAFDQTTASYVYDTMQRVIKSTDAAGLQTTYTYDNNGNLLKAEDSTGKTTTYVYDSMNNVVSSTLSNGAVLSYEYDLLGRIVAAVDALNGRTTYKYNALGQLTSTTDALGRSNSYEYDSIGNTLKYIAANNGEMSYQYDKLGHVTKVTDALGNYASYTFDTSENMASFTDVYGNTSSYEYNGRNLITKINDALDRTYSFAYDNNGNKVETTAPDGTKTLMEYDGLNRLIKLTDAAGLVTTYEYNSLGQLTAEKDNAGKNTRYSYDAAGRVSTITNAIDQTVVYTYDERGNIASIKEADGNITAYTYDSIGNITSSTDAEGKVTTYTYDLNGNLLTKKDYAQRVWQYYYDAANRLTSTKNPLNEETAYEYNSMDFLTKETNAKGVSTVNEYDIAGNLLSVTDGNGNKTSYEYDDLYRITATISADGGKQEYSYDAAGNLLNYKDALGNITAYSYDSMNRAIQITKPTGGNYQYTYDAHDNQTSITDPLGNTTTFAYDLHSSMVSKTLANGAAYTYAYDAIGRIVGQTAPEGLSKSYTYDAAGNLASETDQSNRTASYAYDQMHRLTSSTNPANATTNFGYDQRGNLISVATPKGYTTQYEYDVLDRISKTLDPTGKISEMQYDAAGNLERVVENGGRVYSYTHDNVGNLLTVTNPLNQTMSYTYDSMNRKTSETNLGGNTKSYTYDLNGQTLSVTNELGGVSSFEYDANGNILSATDAENRKVSYTYDLADRLISVTEADIVVAEYAYDSVGNLITYKDGNGKDTAYTYNQLGEMTSTTDPLGNVKEFSYNANAMLDTVTNPDDSTVHYDYDVLDQMISKSYDEDEDAQALWGYDADGNRISMDDVAGTTNYEYDSVGKITAVNLSNGKKITYTYDEYGNLATLTYPDNTTVDYTYNELNQLVQIKDRQNKVTSYERDVNGYVVKVTRPNNTYTTIEHDAMGNVVKIVNMGINPYYDIAMELSRFEYTYDLSGFIKSEIATSDKTVVTNLYIYDSRAQLISNATTTRYNGEITEATETTYTYDNAGNRLTSVKKSGNDLLCNVTYVYNGNNQVTDIFGSCDDNDNKDKHVVLSYDANGNLIKTECNGTEKVVDYTYDNENRLKAVKENGTLLMAALYDGNGDRIFRLDYRKNPQYISNRGGTADNVYYNYSSGGISYDHDMIRDEMLIPNDITQNTSINYELTGYINDINSQYTQVLMEYGANQSITNVYEYGAQRNSATINGSKGYYLYDGRGSVASLSGQSGGNMVQYSYDAYGVTTTNYGNQLNNPYRYNAEYTDSSTGNQYLRARYYDAASGRFLTKDTYLGEPNDPLSRNLYTYARNNPTNLIDPSGHLFGTIILAVIATVTVVTAAVTTYNSVKSHNQQSEQIRNQQSSYERNAEVQTGVNTAPTNLRAPSGPNDKGKFSYYNAKDKKVVTFTDAAAYYEYKKLCEELDKLDQNLAISIVHNTLDVLGVIPGYGEIADATNGLIYLAEGDYLNAGLSFVSCIPVAGDAAGKGSKAANKTLGVASDVAKHGDDIVDAATDIVKHGDNIADAATDIAKHGDNIADAVGDATKSSKTMTWNEFQHANKGKYDKAGMSDAWNQYKKANGLDTPNPKKGNSSLLNKNMGGQRPDGYAAHHIVAGDSPGAQEARDILDGFGIDINGADNGVYLPTDDISGGANHRTLHTADYYDKVNSALSGARNRDEAIDILHDIAEMLSNGSF